MSWLDILQLQRIVNQEVEPQKPNSKVSPFRDFSQNIADFDGLGLVLVLAGGANLGAEFYSLKWYFHHGVNCAKFSGSTKVWGPFTVPGSNDLLPSSLPVLGDSYYDGKFPLST